MTTPDELLEKLWTAVHRAFREGLRAGPPYSAKWVEGEDPPGATPIQGGDPARPSWDEYAAAWLDPVVPEALREAAPRGMDAARMSDGYFQMSDGTAITLTQRACGDLMAAIVDQRLRYEDFAFGGAVLSAE